MDEMDEHEIEDSEKCVYISDNNEEDEDEEEDTAVQRRSKTRKNVSRNTIADDDDEEEEDEVGAGDAKPVVEDEDMPDVAADHGAEDEDED